MLSWDMDPDMAVYDEGNKDHREGNNSTLFHFYSLTISLVNMVLVQVIIQFFSFNLELLCTSESFKNLKLHKPL